MGREPDSTRALAERLGWSQSKVARMGARNAKPGDTPETVPQSIGRDGKRYPRYKVSGAREARMRQVVELRELAGLSMRRIANEVGCSLGTVSNDLFIWSLIKELPPEAWQDE